MPVRSQDNFLIFGSPKIEEDEIREIEAVMRSGWLGTGPRVGQFEREFGRYRGAPHAVALNSCSAALHLALLCLGCRTVATEVVTTPLTFCATANAIIHAGWRRRSSPISIPKRSTSIPCRCAARPTSRTRAIVPVHFAGRPCEMDALMSMARDQELKVIEDCAHAIETQYHGRNVGTIGDFGCFSFYVTKNLMTGEGGMVLARKEEDAATIKVLGLHGMTKDAWKRFGDAGYKHYYVVAAGFKYNMMDLQAAIGLKQLARVEAYWLRRKAIWERYMDELADLPIELPPKVALDTRHAYHLFTIQLDKACCGVARDDFLEAMTAEGIGIGVHYLALTEHPYYQQAFGWRPEDTPHATRVGRGTVSLPISAKLTDQDVTDVISAARLILR